MVFDVAWDLMKADIYHEGKSYESMDDLMPLLNEQIHGWGGENKKLSPFPFPYQSGKLQDKSWSKMKGGASFKDLQPGFKSSEQMLPTVVNWVGGKTGIQPYMRGLADFFPDARPAELYGGSGSTILGLNRGTGFFADINPDNTNLFQQLKTGMGNVELPKNKERMFEMIDRFNDLRFQRDVMGRDLTDDENMELAHNLVGANQQSFFGLKYPTSPKQKAKFPEWYGGSRYTEGPAYKSGWRNPPMKDGKQIRWMPSDVGSIDLSGYANRLKDVEIHSGDLRDTAKLMQGDEFLYLDPQYVGRKIQYGGSDEQLQGGLYDQLQRDTIKIGAEHDGPVVYSNYMVNPQTGLPNQEMIDDLLDANFDTHTWMRKPKRNATPVVEVLGLRNFPEHVQRGMKKKSLFDY